MDTDDSLARRAGPAIAVVVLLHLALLLALLKAPVWPDRQAWNEPAPTWLRLLPLPLPLPQTLPSPAAPESAQAPQAPPKLAANPARPSRPAAPVAAWAPSEATLFVAPDTAPAEPPPPAPAEQPRPLNLSLPRGASSPYRHPALDHLHSKSQPLTLESRLAAVLAPSDGPIIQTHMSDGSLRLRRGTNCALMRPSRTAALDAFNLSVSPKHRQLDNC